MRIVVGSLQQESNTLTSRMSTYGGFEIHRGTAMLSHISVVDYLTAEGAQLIPTLYANALPGGPLRKDDFLRLASELVSLIPAGEAKPKIDGIWLYLHGALHVEEIGSGELALLRMVRVRVGYEIPIALALDFHANNTRELMDLVNVIAGYRTAPHRDMPETEVRAARLLVRCVREGILPNPRMTRCPVVVPGDCVLTDEEPLKSIMQEASQLEREEGMLVCNVFNGQPWVDAPHMGPSMVCVHAWDSAIAKRAANRLAQRFFGARHDFQFSIEACEPAEALMRAYAEQDRPVFVSDSGDNTTAGSSGDNAFLLNLVLRMQMRDVLIAGITDSEAVASCHSAAIGDELELEVGGKIEPASTRVKISGRLVFKGDIEGWYGENAGPAAVVQCTGNDIVLTANRCAFTRIGIFSGLGLDIESYRFVIVKLGYLFPELAVAAQRAILAFTTGGSTERLQDMGMKYITRPVFPLDDGFELDLVQR
jgi:microcystin degradation protein MlrC